MKKLFIFSVVIMLFLFGCSDRGTLKVYNDTSSEAFVSINNGNEISLAEDQIYSESWNLDNSIFSSSEKNVDIDYNGLHVFSASESRTIKPGSTTSVHIQPNAGAITIWNNMSNVTIVNVYIAPSDEDEWGDDVLSGLIDSFEEVSWSVTPGLWDIKIVDDEGDQAVIWDTLINLDETSTFEYTTFKRLDENSSQKNKNKSYEKQENMKVEKN